MESPSQTILNPELSESVSAVQEAFSASERFFQAESAQT